MGKMKGVFFIVAETSCPRPSLEHLAPSSEWWGDAASRHRFFEKKSAVIREDEEVASFSSLQVTLNK
jgi:hypothetical protein